MKDILLINPPYQTITSNAGVGHQIPLGLLMVGGALRDNGHGVRLLDAECRRLSLDAIANEVCRRKPEVVMTGHAGSTPAHPVTIAMLRAIKTACPRVTTVYGGVYPSYHAQAILDNEPSVDFVIRGEGEATAVELMNALTQDPSTAPAVPGLACRSAGRGILTPKRPPIRDLDRFRIGWELIDNWDAYRCFGLGRAAIIQFSRGCPHRCTYCGQHEFWVSWRHRDPVRVADEIEWLRRRHNVRFITIADENPTTRRDVWKRLLEELARRKLGVHFFATIRATDIVRDADLLPLYRAAGILYVLMGIESTSDEVLRQIRKRSTTRDDFQACRLLKQNGIFSVIGHIVGLRDETPATFRSALRQLRYYDGDWLNAMYVTPHDWTPFGREALTGKVVEPDQSKWDYRHQVLAQSCLTPTGIFLRVKWMELRFHLRPWKLLRMLCESDPLRQGQQWWTLFHAGCVWIMETVEFAIKQLSARRKRQIKETRPEPADVTTASSPLAPSRQEAPRRQGPPEGRIRHIRPYFIAPGGIR